MQPIGNNSIYRVNSSDQEECISLQNTQEESSVTESLCCERGCENIAAATHQVASLSFPISDLTSIEQPISLPKEIYGQVFSFVYRPGWLFNIMLASKLFRDIVNSVNFLQNWVTKNIPDAFRYKLTTKNRIIEYVKTQLVFERALCSGKQYRASLLSSIRSKPNIIHLPQGNDVIDHPQVFSMVYKAHKAFVGSRNGLHVLDLSLGRELLTHEPYAEEFVVANDRLICISEKYDCVVNIYLPEIDAPFEAQALSRKCDYSVYLIHSRDTFDQLLYYDQGTCSITSLILKRNVVAERLSDLHPVHGFIPIMNVRKMLAVYENRVFVLGERYEIQAYDVSNGGLQKRFTGNNLVSPPYSVKIFEDQLFALTCNLRLIVWNCQDTSQNIEVEPTLDIQLELQGQEISDMIKVQKWVLFSIERGGILCLDLHSKKIHKFSEAIIDHGVEGEEYACLDAYWPQNLYYYEKSIFFCLRLTDIYRIQLE